MYSVPLEHQPMTRINPYPDSFSITPVTNKRQTFDPFRVHDVLGEQVEECHDPGPYYRGDVDIQCSIQLHADNAES